MQQFETVFKLQNCSIKSEISNGKQTIIANPGIFLILNIFIYILQSREYSFTFKHIVLIFVFFLPLKRANFNTKLIFFLVTYSIKTIQST